MQGVNFKTIIGALLAGLVFMAGVRVAIEMLYPAGTENVVASAPAPAAVLAKK